MNMEKVERSHMFSMVSLNNSVSFLNSQFDKLYSFLDSLIRMWKLLN